MTATQADLASRVDGFRVSAEQDNKVIFVCDDYLRLYKAFIHAITMASTFSDMC